MRFGVGMNTDHTLEEVGLQFSVTRERIRQIEAKALKKIKTPKQIQTVKKLFRKLKFKGTCSSIVEYCIDIAGVVGA